MGIGTYFAQEGVFEFAVKEWGPQPLRLMLASDRLQCHLARCRQGHRRQGDQGPEGQAHRHRRRLARAQPERLRDARLRRPDPERREGRRVLQLRRNVEGHPQQRGRCRDRFHDLRAGQGGRDIAARLCLSADAGRPTRRAGRGCIKIGPYYLPPQGNVRRRPVAAEPAELPSYAYPIFMTYGEQPADLVYGLTKAMIVDYDAYKDGAPGAAGLRCQAPEPDVGRSLPRGRREGAQGGGRLERRA